MELTGLVSSETWEPDRDKIIEHKEVNSSTYRQKEVSTGWQEMDHSEQQLKLCIIQVPPLVGPHSDD